MYNVDNFWQMLGLPNIGSIIRYNNELYRVHNIDDYDFRMIVSNQRELTTLRSYDNWTLVQS